MPLVRVVQHFVRTKSLVRDRSDSVRDCFINLIRHDMRSDLELNLVVRRRVPQLSRRCLLVFLSILILFCRPFVATAQFGAAHDSMMWLGALRWYIEQHG